MKNTPLTSKQVQQLAWGMNITIVAPSRRMKQEAKRKARIWKREEERHYAQYVPGHWKEERSGKSEVDYTWIPFKRIVHKSPIR